MRFDVCRGKCTKHKKSLKLVLLAYLEGQNSFKTEASDVFSTHKWKKITTSQAKNIATSLP